MVEAATEEDVDVIGVSSLATDHLIVPQFIRRCARRGSRHVGVVVGGIVPEDERPALLEAGVSAIFGPGALREAIVDPVGVWPRRARRRSTPNRGSDVMSKEAV